MFARLLDLFKRPAPPEPGPESYHAFTTRYDRVVGPDKLGHPPDDAFRKSVAAFDEAMERWLTVTSISAIESIGRLIALRGQDPLGDTVVTLLLDHSGSMKGQRAIVAAAMATLICEYCLRLGAKVEVLGFTTLSWKGGHSRALWLERRMPKNPGRLCDLLHIVYREADDSTSGMPWHIRQMLRGDILKENVDGEAILWAADRLRARSEKRKVIIPVGDGAPVDDSTLLANGEDYLDKHLRETAQAIEQEGAIQLLAIGIDHDPKRYYRQSATVASIAHYAERVLPFLEQAFAG
ncbi:MAG: hypothetical protein JSR60_14490 [Proteobacteria bacterium]|nr:hypothetical protein [Pseudomonadota bacterium]